MQRLNILAHNLDYIYVLYNHGSYIAKLYHTSNCILSQVMESFHVSEYCTTQMQLLKLSPIQCVEVNSQYAHT